MQKPKLVSLLEQSKRRQVVASPATDIAAVILASQTAMADIVTRNFKGEIAEKVCAECDAMYAKLEAAMEAVAKREAQSAVSALPAPERVIERVTEGVEAKEEANEEPIKGKIKRGKSGLMSAVVMNGKTVDIFRDKDGNMTGFAERA